MRVTRLAASKALSKTSAVSEVENQKHEDGGPGTVSYGPVPDPETKPDVRTQKGHVDSVAAIAVVEAESVFKTFNTAVKLPEGLSIIRDIGGGEYEIVNLMETNASTLGGEEFYHKIKNQSRQAEMFEITGKEWQVAKYKVELTRLNASKFTSITTH